MPATAKLERRRDSCGPLLFVTDDVASSLSNSHPQIFALIPPITRGHRVAMRFRNSIYCNVMDSTEPIANLLGGILDGIGGSVDGSGNALLVRLVELAVVGEVLDHVLGLLVRGRGGTGGGVVRARRSLGSLGDDLVGAGLLEGRRDGVGHGLVRARRSLGGLGDDLVGAGRVVQLGSLLRHGAEGAGSLVVQGLGRALGRGSGGVGGLLDLGGSLLDLVSLQEREDNQSAAPFRRIMANHASGE
ncbi:hypothetical protein DFJ74DRAFT_675518 [Hyaloraphidium curvatum]|nr:hypothetical protein DFJ74DRAFT_675518 [Hyaloraphidium curvatum]